MKIILKYLGILIFLVFVLIHILSRFLQISNNDTISKYSFYALVILAFVYVVKKSRSFFTKWISVLVNPELMPLVRVLYGGVCLFSALQHFSLVPYGIEPFNFLIWNLETPSFLAYALYTLHLLALVSIILGYKLRFAWVILFFTGGAVIPFSLEIFVKNIFNFYAMFIPTYLWYGINNEKAKSYNGWPILLMGLSFSILMTTAGIFKLLDPVWQEGMGLYYSLNIPFFTPRYLWWLLDIEFLMKGLNWVTLVFELATLPLFMFKRTRFYAMITLVGLGFFLTFIMEGIGVVGGPIVLIACILILSLTRYPIILKRFLPKILFYNFNGNKASKTSISSLWVGIVVFWWTITGFYSHMFLHFKYHLSTYPPKYGNYTVNKPVFLSINNSVIARLQHVSEVFYTLRPPIAWEFLWTLELFDYHHLFDRVYFRIIFLDSEGNQYEPVVFFDEDGAISDKQPLPGNEKFILSAFRVMDGMRTVQFKEQGTLSATMVNELNGLIAYCEDKGEKKDGNIYRIAKIQIKQIFQPFKYEGNSKPWKDFEWRDLYNYNLETKSSSFGDNFLKYDYSKLHIDAFKNKIIEPNF